MQTTADKDQMYAAASCLMDVVDEVKAKAMLLRDVPTGTVFAGIHRENGIVYVYGARKGWHTDKQDRAHGTNVTMFKWHDDLAQGYNVMNAMEYDSIYVQNECPCYVFNNNLETYEAAGAASEGVSIVTFRENIQMEFRNNE